METVKAFSYRACISNLCQGKTGNIYCRRFVLNALRLSHVIVPLLRPGCPKVQNSNTQGELDIGRVKISPRSTKLLGRWTSEHDAAH